MIKDDHEVFIDARKQEELFRSDLVGIHFFPATRTIFETQGLNGECNADITGLTEEEAVWTPSPEDTFARGTKSIACELRLSEQLRKTGPGDWT